jgi:MoaA/NifB/PqqE/SkfB family radical SAM enzyme
MQKNTLTTIVTSVNNRPHVLKKMLARLNGQAIAAEEIIIIHTGPDDIEKQISDYRGDLSIKYFFHPGKTIAAARNIGARESEGEIVSFLCSDNLPSPCWSGAIIDKFHGNKRVKVVQGHTVFSRSRIQKRVRAFGFEEILGAVTDIYSGFSPSVDANNFAVKGSLIRRFKMPFDERLETGADKDFYWKLKQERIDIHYCPEMKAVQSLPGNWLDWLTRCYKNGTGKAHLLKLHDDYWDNTCIPMDSSGAMFSRLCSKVLGRGTGKHMTFIAKDKDYAGAVLFFLFQLSTYLAFFLGFLKGRTTGVLNYSRFTTPVDLQLYITSDCNLGCRHCYFHQQVNAPSRSIHPEDASKILDSLNTDLRSVSLVGGEPFISPHIVGICRSLAREIHVKDVYIVTNGYNTAVITHAVDRILETANYNLYVRVSLDGLKDTHNNIRNNPRSFQNAVSTIKALKALSRKKNRLSVEIQTTVTRKNFDELEMFAAFVDRELKIFMAFDMARDFQTGSVNTGFKLPAYGPKDSRLLLLPDQLKQLKTRVADIYNQYLGHGYYDHFQADYQIRLINISVRACILKKKVIDCKAGESMVSVFQDGNVSICEMVRPMGNLAEFDFNLKDLLVSGFTEDLKKLRNSCYCTTSCYTASSDKTMRMQ